MVGGTEKGKSQSFPLKVLAAPRLECELKSIYTMADMIPESWLEKFNERMAREGIPHHQRPFRAMEEWTRTYPVTLALNSPEVIALFDWFERNSPPTAHHIGSVFQGAYFFDAAFWPVDIPLVYGNARLNVFDTLTSMPVPVKQRLGRDPKLMEFVLFWADCVDYGYGHDEALGAVQLSKFGKELFQSAHRELIAATAVLLERRPNPKALESSRMALEMFLKAFIAAHTGLSDKQARNLGHDLEAALQECVRIEPSSELQELAGQLKIFRPIGARYQALHIPAQDLWRGYAVTLFCAATIVRWLTGRDIRPTVRREPDKTPTP